MNESVEEQLQAVGMRDHTQSSEYRIFGPPGTGKTTNLARHVRHAAERFGNDRVLVTSFSRATAAELAGRDTPLDSNLIGTLHSHCFHALGRPAIAEVAVEDWNRRYPRCKITPAGRDQKLAGEDSSEDVRDETRTGDSLLHQLNRFRGMLRARESWPAPVQEFAAKWEDYKAASKILDFCDLIERSARDISSAPTKPSVIVVDEAQDLNPMQVGLVRSWSRSAQYLVLAGDDDQTIYGWAGASPEAILSPEIPRDHKVFLKESMRVPKTVHAVAETLIRTVSRREQKTYVPRPANGEVQRPINAKYGSPEYWILKTAEQHLKRGCTVMLLASCSYMLKPLLAVLRYNGIPFHNPHRKSNGFWNPLRTSSRKSSANRIVSLLAVYPDLAGRRTWRSSDLNLWTECLRDGCMKPGASERIASLPKHAAVTPEILQSIFNPETYASLAAVLSDSPARLLDWWKGRLCLEFRKRIEFPARVTAVNGPKALQQAPQVVVGTIHSVKGAQADVVFLFPDLSEAADAQYRIPGSPRDSVIRTFYVGATRARETLYICSGQTARTVSL